MFENIGGKIKVVAKISCWIGIVLSIVYAITLYGQAVEVRNDSGSILFIYATTCLFLGPLGSWIGSFILYGFGQLVENSNILVENSDIHLDSIIDINKSTENSDEIRDFKNDIKMLPKKQLEKILDKERENYTFIEIKCIEEEIRRRR